MEDRSGFLEQVAALLAGSGARYCVIGGVAVNAYAAPIVTEDLDLVVAVEDLPRVTAIMESRFLVRTFAPASTCTIPVRGCRCSSGSTPPSMTSSTEQPCGT